MTVVIACACLQLVTLAFLRFTRGLVNLNVVVFEVYGTLYSMMIILLLVLSFPPYLGRLVGHPFQVFKEGEEGTTGTRIKQSGVLESTVVNSHVDLVLGLGILSMFLSLNPHTRWHLMLPVHLTCMLAYLLPALIILDLDAARVLLFGAELATLLVIVNLAKRMIQKEKRLNFLHLIQEKTQRCSSEFQLSVLKESSTGATRPEDTRSLPMSVPTTTETGKAFNIVNKDLDAEQMDNIRELGQKEQWLLDLRDVLWNSDQILGVGGFGVVVQGQYQGVGVALKVPKIAPTITGDSSALLELCNELQILRRLRHPNIVSFYGALMDVSSLDLALVLELVDGMPLRSFVRSPCSDVEKARILCHISCALVYLHTRQPQVVHGDLKDSNIYVEARSQSGESTAKLLDFGLSRRITRHARPMGGSLLWVAPEVLQETSGPRTASDVFSFGRVAHFVLTGTRVGEGRGHGALVRDLKAGVVPRLEWPLRDAFAMAYRERVDSCNQAHPSWRPVVLEVHKTMLAVWEQCSGKPGAVHSPLGADLQTELRALRRAAREWKAKPRLPHAKEGEVLAQPHALPGSPGGVVAGGAVRLYPDFDVTPINTQVTLILPAMVRANMTVDAASCCHFHAGLKSVRKTLDLVKEKKCFGLGQTAVGQCGHCGVILTQEDLSAGGSGDPRPKVEAECDVCGEKVRLARPRAHGGRW